MIPEKKEKRSNDSSNIDFNAQLCESSLYNSPFYKRFHQKSM